jgi:hypothetical protein
MEIIIKIIEKRLSDLKTRGKTISAEEDFLKELLDIYYQENHKRAGVVETKLSPMRGGKK